MKKAQYITDDCIIEDELYKSIKNLIKCNICQKIIKDPIRCKSCQNSYCKACIDNWIKNQNKCPNECQNPEYIKNLEIPALLTNIKYLCKNCKQEIKYYDVESHLKEGCKTNKSPTKLIDIIYKKKKLQRIPKDDIGRIRKDEKGINHLSSKKNILFNF